MRSEEYWKGRTTYKAPQYPFFIKQMTLALIVISTDRILRNGESVINGFGSLSGEISQHQP